VLSTLVKGMEKWEPRSVNVTFDEEATACGGPGRSKLFYVLPSPDLLYVVEVVASLLALLFVFDAVSGEKEQGTLKLMLAGSVPRDLIILAKWFGGYVTLALPFVSSVALGLCFLHFAPWVDMGAEAWLRVGWLLLAILLYVSVFFTLGLLVSSLTKRASTSLIVSLFAWAVLVVAVPTAAPLVASRVAPAPPLGMVMAEKAGIERERQQRHREAWQRPMTTEERDRYLEQVDKEAARARTALDAFARNRARKQVSVAKAISRVSPAALLVYVGTDLAETGLAEHFRFLRALSGLNAEVRRFRDDFYERVDEIRRGGVSWPEAFVMAWDPDEAPRLRETGVEFSDTLSESMLDLLILAGYSVVLFMGAYVAFMRYDAR
jgi:ABC-type transport system involved in multi-copper enzyme maturation permease subunit